MTKEMAGGEVDAYSIMKQEVLEDLRERLVKDLQPEKLFAFLRSKMVLDEEDCDEIKAERTRRKKVELFLDILVRKGQCGFDYFCEAFLVNGKTQLHLLNQMLDAFESKLYGNEVEQLPVTQHEHEFINVELLNQNLPKPGEPGAPCLPRVVGLASAPGTAFGGVAAGFSAQSQTVAGDVRGNYGLGSPPPPYSEY